MERLLFFILNVFVAITFVIAMVLVVTAIAKRSYESIHSEKDA